MECTTMSVSTQLNHAWFDGRLVGCRVLGNRQLEFCCQVLVSMANNVVSSYFYLFLLSSNVNLAVAMLWHAVAMFGVLGTSQNQSCRRKTCFRGLTMSGNIHVKNQTQRAWWMLSLFFGAGFFWPLLWQPPSWHNACTKCWNSTHNFILNMPSLWLGDSGFWTSAVEICRNHLTNSTYPAYSCLATCWCGFSRHGNRSTKKGKCVVTRVAVRVNKVTWTSCNSMWRKYFTNCHFGRLLLSGCHTQQCLPETVLI